MLVLKKKMQPILMGTALAAFDGTAERCDSIQIFLFLV